MTLQVQELPSESIIVCTVGLPHTPEEDVRGSLQATIEFKQKMGGQVYRIVDLSQFDLSFSEAMMGMNAERGHEGGVSDNQVYTIYVGSGEWVQFGVKAFQEQEQYGATKNVLHICSTVDEALSFAREHMNQ